MQPTSPEVGCGASGMDPRPGRLALVVTEMNDFNTRIIEEFRANGGKVGGPFAGAPMVLLTTTGARSGTPRTTPLAYLPDGDRIVIFASKAGAPTNPAWYHNLVAHPEATVEVGGETRRVRAEVVTGAERDRLFAEQARRMPGFADYQAKTTRIIPVIALVTT
jgi:deazaflavin-dependent oxidoreductase (nitroreductase family)